MLSSSRYALLNLSETTSPQKLFPSDCIAKKFMIKYSSAFLIEDHSFELDHRDHELFIAFNHD